MLRRTHSVHVYTLSTSDQDLLADADIADSVTVLPFQFRRSVRLALFLNDLIRWDDLDRLDRVNADAAARIDAEHHDVVLVDACRFTYAPYVLRHLITPTAFYCHHGPWRLEPEWRAPAVGYHSLRDRLHAPAEALLRRRLVRDDTELARSAAMIVTNSEYTRGQIHRMYGIDAVVCPPGVDLPANGHKFQRSGVISVGALEVHKGFDFLIRALATIQPQDRPRLTIVANEANPVVRRQITALAAALEVTLELHERVSESRLAELLASSAVFVYGAHQEPLGMGPLEAMAARLPVVAVSEGGLREVVTSGKTGWLVDRDARAFGACVSKLLASPELQARMGEEARNQIERSWTWPHRVAALESVLMKLTSPLTSRAAP
jgi:glycosyltransferase involved in cell wall biosynthesis